MIALILLRKGCSKNLVVLHAECAKVFLLFTDIDECQDNIDDCHIMASCTNTMGSFNCQCKSGYKGNGTNCVGK